MSRAKARAERISGDAYYTPDDVARQCVVCLKDAPGLGDLVRPFIIEPSVGGGAFARAIKAAWPKGNVLGVDIDPNAVGFKDCYDSLVLDWMEVEFPPSDEINHGVDAVIGNPPFAKAQEHIEHTLAQIGPTGTVGMLLRLNFLEGQKRAAFWKAHPFDECFVLSARPSFTGGGTDATAYAFFVWRAGSARRLMHWIAPPEGAEKDPAMPRAPRKPRKKPIVSVQPEDVPGTIAYNQAQAAKVKAPTAPWIAEVRSNVKSETWDGWRVQFTSPKVLLIGRNGGGKSRIAQAIELACSGRATDVVGRDPKAPVELVALAPPGEGTMIAEALWSDGHARASWSMQVKEDRSAGKPRWSTVSGGPMGGGGPMGDLLPIRALEASLYGSADGARSFFLSTIAGKITDGDVLSRLPTAFHAVWASNVSVFTPSGGPVERLLNVIDGAKAKVREWKATAKDADNLIQQLGARLSACPTEKQISELQRTIVDVTTQIATLETQSRFVQAHAARLLLAKLRAVLAAVPATPAPPPAIVPPNHSGVIALLEAAAVIAQAGIDKHLSTCPICSQGVSPYTYADTRDRARAMIVELRSTPIMPSAPDVAPTTVTVDGEVSAISAVQTTITQITPGALEGMDIGPAPASLDLSVLVQERDRLARVKGDAHTGLIAMRADQQRWGDVQRARDRSAEAATQIDHWQRAADAFALVRDELVETAVLTFTDEVSAYLPPGDRFAARLRDDAGREVFQIGLMRGEVFHAALSGAEETRVLAAVAAVCSRGGGVVIPRERAHDAHTLGEAMRALVAAPGQIILTSTVLPEGNTDGWQVIDVAQIGNEVVDARPSMEEPPTFDSEDELPWGYSTEGEA